MNYPAEILLHNLRGLSESNIGGVSEHITFSRNMAHIGGGESSPLAVFGQQGISLGGVRDIFPLPKKTFQKHKKDATLAKVFSILGCNSISLNHIGMGYQVDDLDREVERICTLMKNSVYKVFEDMEGINENMRWLFIGTEDKHNLGKPCVKNPMFEIVLPEKKLLMPPHVQFDIDTNLSQAIIEQRIGKYFGDEFFDWHLDIDGIGRVLSMGTFENRGINLRVGIGNNKRSRKEHRNSMELARLDAA